MAKIFVSTNDYYVLAHNFAIIKANEFSLFVRHSKVLLIIEIYELFLRTKMPSKLLDY